MKGNMFNTESSEKGQKMHKKSCSYAHTEMRGFVLANFNKASVYLLQPNLQTILPREPKNAHTHINSLNKKEYFCP